MDSNDEIIIYGTSWCYDSFRAKKYFERNGIPFRWIDIDSNPEGRKFVEQANGGMRSVPTIRFPDGSLLVEPSDDEMAVKLGLKQKA